MGPIDEFEEKLEAALAYAEDKNVPGHYSVLVSTFARKLEEHGVRVVLAAVGKPMRHPQVEVTADMDDVTASVVAQVVDPVLRKAGVPDPIVSAFAGAAGTATVKFLDRYRVYRAQKAVAAGQPVPEPPFRPKWDPSKRRPKPTTGR
jgi:hypothetical protein